MARSATAGVATAETDAVEVVARVAAQGSASPGARRARAAGVRVREGACYLLRILHRVDVLSRRELEIVVVPQARDVTSRIVAKQNHLTRRVPHKKSAREDAAVRGGSRANGARHIRHRS